MISVRLWIQHKHVAPCDSSGVIGERVRVMSMGSLSYVGGGGGTLGGAMEDVEVALVDGIFEGAFGALGDESLEVEALVDAIEVMVVDDE
ncbi:hypothetical protein Tco_0837153 [Tanacetum coccineum]